MQGCADQTLRGTHPWKLQGRQEGDGSCPGKPPHRQACLMLFFQSGPRCTGQARHDSMRVGVKSQDWIGHGNCLENYRHSWTITLDGLFRYSVHTWYILNTYFISEHRTLVVLQRMCSSSMGKPQMTTHQKFWRQWTCNHITCSLLTCSMFPPVARPFSSCRSAFPRKKPFTRCCISNSLPSSPPTTSQPTMWAPRRSATSTGLLPTASQDFHPTPALRNEIMILEVLQAQEPVVFRQELFNTLTTYYEEIQSMSGAGGRPQPKHFKHQMIAAGGAAGGGEQAAGWGQRAAAASRRRHSSCESCQSGPPPPGKAEKGVPVRVAQRRSSQ